MHQMKGITDVKLENYEVHLPSYSIAVAVADTRLTIIGKLMNSRRYTSSTKPYISQYA